MPHTIRTHMGKLLLALLLCLVALPQIARAAGDPLPERAVDLRNLPVTGAASVLTSSLTGGRSPDGSTVNYPSFAYRVTVCVTGTDSVFSVDFGTDVVASKLNSGTALTADCLYTFTFAATSADSVNFVFATTTTVTRLIVEEIRGGGM